MKIQKPNLPRQLEEVDDFQDLVEQAKREDTEIAGKHLKGLTFTTLELSKVCFRECLFENCKFLNCQFQRADFIDGIFEACDLSNSDFSDGCFLRCSIRSCKCLGINARDTGIQHLTIENSNLQYANFFGASFKGMHVGQSDMTSAMLTECKFTAVEFEDVQLTQANFFRTALKGIDFTKSRMDGIIVSPEDLKGAIVNTYQAADLAKLLGLIIKE